MGAGLSLSHMGAIEWFRHCRFSEVEKNEIERHENSALFPFLEFITWQILGSKIIVQGNEL